MAYAGVYGHAPPRNQKQNALCKQLAQRLGPDAAESVARFYLTHRNRFYVEKTHQLEYCVKDAEGLLTQMRAGYRITTADARRVDHQQTNDQTFAAVTAKLKAEGVFKSDRDRMRRDHGVAEDDGQPERRQHKPGSA